MANKVFNTLKKKLSTIKHYYSVVKNSYGALKSIVETAVPHLSKVSKITSQFFSNSALACQIFSYLLSAVATLLDKNSSKKKKAFNLFFLATLLAIILAGFFVPGFGIIATVILGSVGVLIGAHALYKEFKKSEAHYTETYTETAQKLEIELAKKEKELVALQSVHNLRSKTNPNGTKGEKTLKEEISTLSTKIKRRENPKYLKIKKKQLAFSFYKAFADEILNILLLALVVTGFSLMPVLVASIGAWLSIGITILTIGLSIGGYLYVKHLNKKLKVIEKEMLSEPKKASEQTTPKPVDLEKVNNGSEFESVVKEGCQQLGKKGEGKEYRESSLTTQDHLFAGSSFANN